MKSKLSDIAKIYYGPYETGEISGPVKYLVSSHFDDFFHPTLFKESYIEKRSDLTKYLLQRGDVIITGKGHRLFAWAYDEKYGEVVPSSLFYILRLHEPDRIRSEYLANFLNSEKIHYQLKSIGAGTSMPSIPKKELGQLEVTIPTLEEQQKVIQLTQLLNRDVALATLLLEKKKALRQSILNRVINTTKHKR